MLARWEERFGIASGMLPGERLARLLETAHLQAGHRCVVLVDEYDKPLLETMDDPELEERNRAALKGFYSVLKSADEHLRFVFITGVTKFSKVSIFSDLNQLSDISLSEDYAGICGITEGELLDTLAPELEALAERRRMSHVECLEALRVQYDGYCFHPDGPCDDPFGSSPDGSFGSSADDSSDSSSDSLSNSPFGETVRSNRMVYNPFSLLKALQERRLGSWWFETGTPTFLVNRMRDVSLDPKRLVDGSIYATERRLSDYRADDPDPVPLLYQTGYLTIRAYDPDMDEYTLAVPNGEVEYGLIESLLPAWAPGYAEARGTDVFTLRRLIEAGDADGVRRVLASLFASIPYTRTDDPFENYFQAVIWLVFTLLGRNVRVEMHTAIGRVDCLVEARGHVWLFEFKRDGTPEEALAQIEERGYALPFVADPRRLHKVGCTFDSTTRLLDGWEER